MVELNRADGDHADEESTDQVDTERSKTEHSEAEHLENVEDGCGCTEIWEHLSEQRSGD